MVALDYFRSSIGLSVVWYFTDELDLRPWVMWPKRFWYGISIGIWVLTSKGWKCAIKTVSSDDALAHAHAEASMYMSNEHSTEIFVIFFPFGIIPHFQHVTMSFDPATGVKVASKPEFRSRERRRKHQPI